MMFQMFLVVWDSNVIFVEETILLQKCHPKMANFILSQGWANVLVRGPFKIFFGPQGHLLEKPRTENNIFT